MAESLSTVIDRLFGVHTREAPNRENTAVTTTPSLIMRSDPSRVAASIHNMGTVLVIVRNKLTPTPTIGFPIQPNGGSMILNPETDFHMVGHEWSAITVSGTAELYVSEVLIEPNANPE